MNPDLRRKLDIVPRRPGVYLMKDRGGKIIYVGKAKRLDLRLRSHFSGSSDHPKQQALLARVHDLDVIATDTEIDALILEMTLIKEKRPVYNINLKDDKRFPFVKVTVGEEFPKFFLVRRIKDDGARYFGPYTDVRSLRQTLRTLRTIFPIRSCLGDRPGRGPQHKECLDYYIHRCLAPCIGATTAAEYRKAVDEICLFLAGDGDTVRRKIQADMEAHAERLEFEAAGRRRDQLAQLERMLRRQRMVDVQRRDTDLFAVCRSGDAAWGVVLQVRDGRVLGKERRMLRGAADAPEGEVMAAFLLQYYAGIDLLPPQVATAAEPADRELVSAWLERKRGGPVRMVTPQRGPLAHLVHLALQNARLDMEASRGLSHRSEIAPAVYELQEVLGLQAPPVRIECFDISNIQGSHPVASMVVMVNGKPARSEYRRYRMTSPGPDDFAMMAEVTGRRARRVVAGEFPAADLFLIDGGVGQVGAAREALAAAGLGAVPVIGLAKREEEIIVPGRPESLRLPRTAPALKLLIQLRDEAHRFAIEYHRQRRGRSALRSKLDEIPGIGENRRLVLLQHFGSVDAVARASEADLARVPGLGPAIARKLYRALHADGGGVAA